MIRTIEGTGGAGCGDVASRKHEHLTSWLSRRAPPAYSGVTVTDFIVPFLQTP